MRSIHIGLSAFSIAFGFASPPAFAENARCYEFTQPSVVADELGGSRVELWCYRDVSGGTFIFNADGESVRPETAFLKLENGRIAQGSLAGGKVELLNLPLPSINPLPVPLKEPRGSEAKSAPRSPAFASSVEAVLEELRKAAPLAAAETKNLEGRFAADAGHKPWRGYWWAFEGFTLRGPMEKYDAFMQSRGRRTDATGWEGSVHRYRGVNWEGHCNGWAASAVLRPEPRSGTSDGASGQYFSIGDQKGLLAEMDFCVNSAFYGYRTESSSGLDPANFHKVLLHYIGSLRKPIALNVNTDGTVDNRIISGYTLDVSRDGSGYEVTARVRIHSGAANDNPEVTGIADSYNQTYRYRFNVDASGNPVSGSWLSSDRPGFVWVPLGSGRCSHENPHLDEGYLGALMRL